MNDSAVRQCDPSRILVVDDEPSIRSLFQMAISMAFPNMCVDLAGNGLEAVNLFQEKLHGVITMDLHMPLMDGWNAFNRIQEFCASHNITSPRVIFITGFALPKIVDKIVGDGSYHGILMKPVMLSDIVREVKKRLFLTTT